MGKPQKRRPVEKTGTNIIRIATHPLGLHISYKGVEIIAHTTNVYDGLCAMGDVLRELGIGN